MNDAKVDDLRPLTSLRFVAAMMIVMRHAKLYFPWPIVQGLPDTLAQGVSFFFVLSGFILTHVYTSQPMPSYGHFLRKRLARLWPIHVFAILVLVTFVRPDSITFDGPGFFSKWTQLGFNLTLTHSLLPFTSSQFSWNVVSWSISTEAFFYLAFPLLLINIRNTWHWKLAGSALLVALAISAVTVLKIPEASADVNAITVTSILYANPFIRGFEFCLGMATWVLWDKYAKRSTADDSDWSALELMISLAVFAWLAWISAPLVAQVSNTGLRDYLGMAGSAPLFAMLILVMAQGRGAFSPILTWKPFVFLGEISFSVYMLHMILMKMFFTRNQQAIVSPMAFMGALFFVAAGSYFMIERPAQRFIMRKRAPLSPPIAGVERG